MVPNNITSILYVLGRKSVHVLILGKKHISSWSYFGIVQSIDVFFSNLTQTNTYIPGIQFVVLNVSIIIVPPRA